MILSIIQKMLIQFYFFSSIDQSNELKGLSPTQMSCHYTFDQENFFFDNESDDKKFEDRKIYI